MPNDVRQFLDPVPFAREAGRELGQRQMRDRIRDEFAAFAVRHPDPVVSDELWSFVNHIERMDIH